MKYLFAICLSEKILYFCRKQTEQLMKILHTADWHLGQTFYEYDRREEHFHFLEWLKQQIKQHEIDVLLIAGDVFDSPNPSAESQRVYYRFFKEKSHLRTLLYKLSSLPEIMTRQLVWRPPILYWRI